MLLAEYTFYKFFLSLLHNLPQYIVKITVFFIYLVIWKILEYNHTELNGADKASAQIQVAILIKEEL